MNQSRKNDEPHFALLRFRKNISKNECLANDVIQQYEMKKKNIASDQQLYQSIRDLNKWAIHKKLKKDLSMQIDSQKEYELSQIQFFSKNTLLRKSPEINLPMINTIMKSGLPSEKHGFLSERRLDSALNPNQAEVISKPIAKKQSVLKMISPKIQNQKFLISSIIKSKILRNVKNLDKNLLNSQIKNEAEKIICNFDDLNENITPKNIDHQALRKSILAEEKHRANKINSGQKNTCKKSKVEIIFDCDRKKLYFKKLKKLAISEVLYKQMESEIEKVKELLYQATFETRVDENISNLKQLADVSLKEHAQKIFFFRKVFFC